MRGILLILSLVPTGGAAGDTPWPGLPPDCWAESRLVHGGEENDLWKRNMQIMLLKAKRPEPGVFSPNKGYFFVVKGGRPSARVTIYAEREHIIQIDFSNLHGLSDIRWVNEKLLFMRPWWGRIAATDIIYDVEKAQVIFAEALKDGRIAYQQYLQSCPLHGCDCIKKK